MKVTFNEQNQKPLDGTKSDTGRRNTIVTTNVGIYCKLHFSFEIHSHAKSPIICIQNSFEL